MKRLLLAGLVAALSAPMIAEAQMTRYEGACVRSILRHGSVMNADEVVSACRCAEAALDRNGIGESVRVARNMYVAVDGEELFEFSAPRYLWDGNGDYEISDYPWRLSEADKGTRRDDHCRGANEAQACLSPRHIGSSFFFAGSQISKLPKTTSAKTRAPLQLAAASPEELKNLKTLKARNRPTVDYPLSALRGKQEGTIILAVKLDANSRAVKVALVSNSSGSQSLLDTAHEAVLRTRFGDGQQTGGAFDGTFMFEFRLPSSPPALPPRPG